MQRLMVRKEKALSKTSKSFKNGVTLPKVNSKERLKIQIGSSSALLESLMSFLRKTFLM